MEAEVGRVRRRNHYLEEEVKSLAERLESVSKEKKQVYD